MNSKHKNINFFLKAKKMNKCPSLMSTCSMRMVSLWLMFTEKKHALEFILTFSSFIPLEHKFVLVYTLLHRCFCLVFDMSKFHFEIENLNKILLSNGYSNTFIDKCLSKFMDKLYVKKPVIEAIPKKQLYLLLPLKGKMSALVKSGSARLLHKRLPFCKVKIAFKTSNL